MLELLKRGHAGSQMFAQRLNVESCVQSTSINTSGCIVSFDRFHVVGYLYSAQAHVYAMGADCVLLDQRKSASFTPKI